MYVVIIGFYLLFSVRQKLTGLLLMIGALAYFAFAVYVLSTSGDGAMFDRYDNLIAYKSWGFASIIITLLVNPAYFLNELFIPGKRIFIITYFPSLGFLPLMQRRYHRLLLLLPVVIMNLMPAFRYQHELVYQYHYATTAIMLYMIILTLADRNSALYLEMRREKAHVGISNMCVVYSKAVQISTEPYASMLRNEATSRKKHSAKIKHESRNAGGWQGLVKKREWAYLALPLCIAIVCTVYYTTRMLISNYYPVSYYISDRSVIESIKSELDEIPANVSVQASGMLTTYLSGRDIVYDFEHNQRDASPHKTDYVVIDQRYAVSDVAKAYINRLLSDKYTVLFDTLGQLLILVNPNSQLDVFLSN